MVIEAKLLLRQVLLIGTCWAWAVAPCQTRTLVILSWVMGSPRFRRYRQKGGCLMVGKCKENPGVHTEARGCFQAGDFKIQPRTWQPTPVFLPRKSHGWKSLVGYSPWGRKESDTTERAHFTSLVQTKHTWWVFASSNAIK